jgi:hypothetical protein
MTVRNLTFDERLRAPPAVPSGLAPQRGARDEATAIEKAVSEVRVPSTRLMALTPRVGDRRKQMNKHSYCFAAIEC